MKIGSHTILTSLLSWSHKFDTRKLLGLQPEYTFNDPPLRAELFSADQMEQHGKKLAGLHKISSQQFPDRLLKRLSENETVLAHGLNLLTAAVKEGRHITPAEEWLVDNFYLLEEQIRLAKSHLPKKYSQQLPRLQSGPCAGLPRVYDIALEIISHGDGRIDPTSLSRFITAYQTIEYLQLGELWAIPIMLRLALIENLRRIAARVVSNRLERDQADFWALQMLDVAEKDPKSLILVIADMARAKPSIGGSFVAELVRRLQGQSAALALSLPLTWLEQSLSESGLTIAQLVHSDSQHQAMEQVSISNSIASLRFLESMNWQDFVEQKSIVEQVLRQDPSGTYEKMDFATRDNYRHVIEKMAKKCALSEGKLAQLAMKLAQQAMHSNGRYMRSAHVGYYLIDDGFYELTKTAQIHYSPVERFGAKNSRLRLFLYLGSLALITFVATFCFSSTITDTISDWLRVIVIIALLLATSQFAIAMVNWLVTILVSPKALPRMDFSEGIPNDCRTIVVIPSMLSSMADIESLVGALEVRFLANQDPNLHFALLTDFSDANKQKTPLDERLLLACKGKIEELNDKYKGNNDDRFFLLHRPRIWNATDKIWMGYERKRGKLADLNALLRGYGEDRFSLIVGRIAILQDIKYVITLDTDTHLPRDEGKQLVGAMAHPLNHPSVDKNKSVIKQGYGILQPRVSTNLPGSNLSLYAQLNSSEPGIDPYTRTVSDVYQDLFTEGSFIGKGIYDVDAFQSILKDRFPDNRILSHDLLEGCYIRSGLLSDVELYEEYPHSYLVDVKRRQRWIRGDWQLLDWLLPSVPGYNSARELNPISALSKWKIFDNLRRSMVPLALTSLLILAWIALSPVWYWTLFVIAIMFGLPVLTSVFKIFGKPENISLRQHYAAISSSVWQHACQSIFALACLPYESVTTFNTIITTVIRMLITRKNLLQWSLLGETEKNSSADLMAFYQAMFVAPVLVVLIAIYLFTVRSNALIVALPILLLWFASPILAWRLSQPIKAREPKLTADQIVFLRMLARKTWAFFETFVGIEDNWLPPDNYQENRPVALAHRTSPTNIGLSLLSDLSAYDFGYISIKQLIERLNNTLTTMESLARYKGHFYNWYDTQSLKQLSPNYISTVDSGNLSGSLLVLGTGLNALLDRQIINSELFNGLNDTLLLLQECLEEVSSNSWIQFRDILDSAKIMPPLDIAVAKDVLEKLSNGANSLVAEFNANSQGYKWACALAQQCSEAIDEIRTLTPWALLPSVPKNLPDFPNLEKIPTLNELAKFESLLMRTTPLPDVEKLRLTKTGHIVNCVEGSAKVVDKPKTE